MIYENHIKTHYTYILDLDMCVVVLKSCILDHWANGMVNCIAKKVNFVVMMTYVQYYVYFEPN